MCIVHDNKNSESLKATYSILISPSKVVQQLRVPAALCHMVPFMTQCMSSLSPFALLWVSIFRVGEERPTKHAMLEAGIVFLIFRQPHIQLLQSYGFVALLTQSLNIFDSLT